MKFALVSRFCTLAALAGLLLSSCAKGSLPGAPFAPAASAVHVSGISASFVVLSKPQCNLKEFQLCVMQGASAKLGIKVTCKTSTGVTTSCGDITWSTKLSNKGLKAKFDPKKDIAPKDSTVETVTADKTIKPGVYSQTLTASSTIAGKKSGKFPVTVEKS
jgi:hypothetical protein